MDGAAEDEGEEEINGDMLGLCERVGAEVVGYALGAAVGQVPQVTGQFAAASG